MVRIKDAFSFNNDASLSPIGTACSLQHGMVLVMDAVSQFIAALATLLAPNGAQLRILICKDTDLTGTHSFQAWYSLEE